MRLRNYSIRDSADTVLDVLAIVLAFALMFPLVWLCIVASIFFGIEWWHWLYVGLVVGFITWRLYRLI